MAWKWISVIVVLSYMGLILDLSLIPDKGSPAHLLALVSPNVQNLLHIPAFGFLALLWIVALGIYQVSEGRRILIASIIALAFGLLTEMGQIWVPGRFPSILDLTLDLTGILLFIWFYQYFQIEERIKFLGLGVRDQS